MVWVYKFIIFKTNITIQYSVKEIIFGIENEDISVLNYIHINIKFSDARKMISSHHWLPSKIGKGSYKFGKNYCVQK